MPKKAAEKKRTEMIGEDKKEVGFASFNILRKFIDKVIGSIFKKKKHIKLGLYGPPNGGKTTLANRICIDWLGEEMGSVSAIPHETREIQVKEQVNIKSGKKELSFNLVDTPGIATKIDYEDFVRKGIKKTDAKKRAREATKGVIDAIKWLDDMDAVLVVLDATKDPYTQVNITIIGNLVARNIPVLVVGNKIDLRKADLKGIEAAFPQYDVIGISAKLGKNIDKLYEALFVLVD
ncbi:MAG: Era-like GTP-binding protein [Candidatus Woesearchaeota archaeon]|nr:Era-like GTP-binding protein [Candidatus Woesearchaeota archaeon]